MLVYRVYTQGYHDVSGLLRARTGGVDINWCTLGSWASKTAGRFIVSFRSLCVTLARSRERVLRRGAAERAWHAILRLI